MKPIEEWIRQADYDLDTASYMLKGDRRAYAVFMAHLAVEKALKGLYQKRMNRIPPRTHNLLYLIEQSGLQPPSGKEDFLVALTQAQGLTRYGDSLAKLQQDFTPPDCGRCHCEGTGDGAMGKDAALSAVRRFRDELAHSGVTSPRIILYGSHATGTAREDSDIDIVVISSTFEGRGMWERINLIAPAIRRAHALIEAVPMTPKEWATGESVVVGYASEGQEV